MQACRFRKLPLLARVEAEQCRTPREICILCVARNATHIQRWTELLDSSSGRDARVGGAAREMHRA